MTMAVTGSPGCAFWRLHPYLGVPGSTRLTPDILDLLRGVVRLHVARERGVPSESPQGMGSLRNSGNARPGRCFLETRPG